MPPQALFLMNHPFVRSAAEALLSRPDVAGLGDPAARVDRLFRLVYGRAPRDEEASLARAFLAGRPVPWVASARRS